MSAPKTGSDWRTLSSTPLTFSPWIPWQSQRDSIKHHLITGTTLRLAHIIASNTDLTTSLSPFSPLKDNPDFLPGVGNDSLQTPDTKPPLLAKDCFHTGLSKSHLKLKNDYDLPRLPWWTYFHIRDYAIRGSRRHFFSRELTDIEKV